MAVANASAPVCGLRPTLSLFSQAAGGGFVVFYLSVLFAIGTTLTVMSSVILARWSAQPQAQQREALYPALYAG